MKRGEPLRKEKTGKDDNDASANGSEGDDVKGFIKREFPVKRKIYRQKKKCPKCDFTTKQPTDFREHKKGHRKTVDTKGKIILKRRFSTEQIRILESIYAIEKKPKRIT